MRMSALGGEQGFGAAAQPLIPMGAPGSSMAMRKPHGTVTMAVVVVLAALAATGVAWFAHLIPHV